MAKPSEQEEPAADQPLYQFLTYRLSRVQAKLNAQASALLQQHAGLTLTKWRILALVGAAGQTRLSRLAKVAALDKGLLSRNLKLLVADGLICSAQDEFDQRIQQLSLTAEGRRLFEETLPIMQQRQAKLREALDRQEIDLLYKALDKLELAAEWREETA